MAYSSATVTTRDIVWPNSQPTPWRLGGTIRARPRHYAAAQLQSREKLGKLCSLIDRSNACPPFRPNFRFVFVLFPENGDTKLGDFVDSSTIRRSRGFAFREGLPKRQIECFEQRVRTRRLPSLSGAIHQVSEGDATVRIGEAEGAAVAEVAVSSVATANQTRRLGELEAEAESAGLVEDAIDSLRDRRQRLGSKPGADETALISVDPHERVIERSDRSRGSVSVRRGNRGSPPSG